MGISMDFRLSLASGMSAGSHTIPPTIAFTLDTTPRGFKASVA